MPIDQDVIDDIGAASVDDILVYTMVVLDDEPSKIRTQSARAYSRLQEQLQGQAGDSAQRRSARAVLLI